MPIFNKQNIDQKTNKPTTIVSPNVTLNRALQTRRDDDVIRSPKRTLYDIDYAIKWFIENDIRPQITADQTLIDIPIIYANGEKWDNVQRLGYLRDEKGMLQSPVIMLKRNSVIERDNIKTLDVNYNPNENVLTYRSKYNERNRYNDPMPNIGNQGAARDKIYVINIPKYVTIEYDMMIWCDFTMQLNDVVEQILPFGRFSWGNGPEKFPTTIGSVNFETINTVGEDRLVRATIPLTVLATLLSETETQISTIKKMYAIKKVVFDTNIYISSDLFSTTVVPSNILQMQSHINSGGTAQMFGATSGILTVNILNYLTSLTEQTATYSNSTTVTIAAIAGTNPLTGIAATKNQFDVYINGQYIDKAIYQWTPSNATSQTIVFDTSILGYTLEATDTIIVNGRWA
jgi:hypothetical protein